MTEPARTRMTADEFIAWALARPKRERCELVAGDIVATSPERLAHALLKDLIYRRLAEAVEAANLPCTVFPDGMAVEIDANTVYEPDALVRCGATLPDDTIKITDPIIVVEVLSPSTRARDTGAKLEDYFRLPSLRHFLIVKTENRSAIHHARAEDGTIATRIIRGTEIRFDPPGIEINL